MLDYRIASSNYRVPHVLTGIGARAISLTLRPMSSAASAAAHASIDFERAAMVRALDSAQFERFLSSASSSERIPDMVVRMFESPAAKRVIDGFFASGLFDVFVSRLLESDALWELVDRVADSPAVTAAITQQSLGFADQMGEEVRSRSRKADDWLERKAHRLPGWRHRQVPLTDGRPDPAAP